mgnify:CR=1 FL=1
MGVITKELFGKKDTIGDVNSLSCDLENGTIIALGHSICKKAENRVQDGSFVRMRVDLVKDRVEWLKADKG